MIAARSLILAAVGTLVALTPSMQPASAVVPRDGYGFGVTDPDPAVKRSLGPHFESLGTRTFRLLLPWDVADDPVLLSQVAQRLDAVEAAGADQILVSFGPSETWGGTHFRPTPAAWIGKVRRFVEAYDSRVDIWGPANEPNEGVGWLKDGGGVAKLAGYYAELYKLIKVERAASGDKILSPEFHDHLDSSGNPISAGSTYPPGYSTLDRYIDLYEAHVQGKGVGEGFGDFVGWHPYKGLRLQSRAGTDDLAAAIPAGKPIWITEVGAVRSVQFADGTGAEHEIEQTAAEQLVDVQWLVGSPSGLANHPRVERVYYWHMRDHNDRWDTALLDDDGRRRDIWYVWCEAIRPSRMACARAADTWIAAASWGWASTGSLDLLVREIDARTP